MTIVMATAAVDHVALRRKAYNIRCRHKQRKFTELTNVIHCNRYEFTLLIHMRILIQKLYRKREVTIRRQNGWKTAWINGFNQKHCVLQSIKLDVRSLL